MTMRAGSLSRPEALEWALDQGVPLYWRACPITAGKGHLKVIVYLMKHHVSPSIWDKETCLAAASSGRLEILKHNPKIIR
jgi:hypothetical protein